MQHFLHCFFESLDNQRKFFESAPQCRKRTLKVVVATRFNPSRGTNIQKASTDEVGLF